MYHHTPRVCTKLMNNNIYFNLFSKRNAGHSKWANIRHIKALKDGQKSQMFTKLGRQMRVAIQMGGSIDPKLNSKLEQVIQQAKRVNMPAGTIESIIKSTLTNKNQSKSHLVEIKGPGNCIILCEVFTENLHGLRQILATILKKHFSKFSDGGGGIHLFDEKGVIIVDPPQGSNKQEDILDIVTEHAIMSGAEDVHVLEDGSIQFLSSPSTFNNVQIVLEKLNYKIVSASFEYLPNKLQTVNDSDLELCSRLFEKLESVPEVIKLYDNIG